MLEFSLEFRLSSFCLRPNLTADRGVTALYGPSGAGKSLTLQCLAGLIRPDRGWIRLNGRTIYDGAAGVHIPPHGRRVGLVFQEYALFPHLTVAANLAYGLRRVPRSEVRARIEAMLRLLGLDELGRRYPSELSGGQRQRVALGRGLIIQPDLLLLDEPFSALDQIERERLRGEVLELLRGFGGTTILVTHSLQEAYLMAREIAVIEQGRILQAGPRDAVLHRPLDRRVAEAVGASNIFQGTVAAGPAGQQHIRWRGQLLEVAGPLAPPGTTVEFCIRPEDVRVVWPERVAGRSNVLRGRLTSEVKRGVDYLLQFRAEGEAGGAGEIAVQCSEHFHSLMKLQPGMEVWIALPAEKLHILAPPDAG
jgi:molybdate transport system ATP-binding protein